MDTKVRIAWIIAAVIVAIGGGIVVSSSSKVGGKKTFLFAVVSAVIAVIMYSGVCELFLLFKHEETMGNALAGILGAIGFTGSIHLCMIREEDNSVKK